MAVERQEKFIQYLKRSKFKGFYTRYDFTDSQRIIDESKYMPPPGTIIESSMERFLRITYDRIINHIARRFESELGNIKYIGPARESFQRFYIASGMKYRDVGARGEHAIDILHSEWVSRRKKASTFKHMMEWLEEFGMAKDLKFSTPKYGGKIPTYLYVSHMRNKISNVWSPTANQGFGVSQVFPLILEGFYAVNGSTLLVEQPEIHLHPAAQFKLADLLVTIAGRGVNLIVESHSAHIIQRLQTLVAAKPKLLDKLSIILFEMKKDGTSVSELKLDPSGRTVNWPKSFRKGFLDGAFWEADRRIDYQVKKQKKKKNV